MLGARRLGTTEPVPRPGAAIRRAAQRAESAGIDAAGNGPHGSIADIPRAAVARRRGRAGAVNSGRRRIADSLQPWKKGDRCFRCVAWLACLSVGV